MNGMGMSIKKKVLADGQIVMSPSVVFVLSLVPVFETRDHLVEVLV